MAGSTWVDRRRFLAGSAGAMGAAVFGRLPLGLLAEQGAPPEARGWDAGSVRHLLPAANESRFLVKVSFDRPLAGPVLRVGGAAATARMTDTAGRALAVPGVRPRRRKALHALARGRGGRGALRALAAGDLPRPRRTSRPLPAALLHLRGRPRRQLRRHRRAERLPPHGHPQPAAAPRPRVRPRCGGRERRPHVLGPAHLARRRGRGAQPERTDLELRLLRLAVRGEQRGGDEGGRGAADRAGVRHRLPLDARLLPAGRPRPLGERRRERRDRQLPDPVVPVAARARDAAPLLPGVPARRPAPGGAALVRRGRPRRPVGELRHPALRPAGRGAALRRPPHPDARRPDRGLRRPAGRALARRTHARRRGAAPRARPVEPFRLERREVGRVVPRHPGPGERGADDGRAQALLAGGMAAAARPAGAGHRRAADARPARRQRRSARHRHGDGCTGRARST